MKILFDQGTPVPLRRALPIHVVVTAFERGWSNVSNGNLLRAAEAEFDLLITTDKNLMYQQNLDKRRMAILVLPTTKWPAIQLHQTTIANAVDAIKPGQFLVLEW